MYREPTVLKGTSCHLIINNSNDINRNNLLQISKIANILQQFVVKKDEPKVFILHKLTIKLYQLCNDNILRCHCKKDCCI